MNTSLPLILLIEDDPHDAFFLTRALQKVRPELPVHIVTDGEQALDYLNGHHKYSDRSIYPLPSIILLDLKLPYLHGFQVLQDIHRHPGLAAIRVFVLTSSAEERDRQRALELGALGFFIKPPSPEMLLQILDKTVTANSPV